MSSHPRSPFITAAFPLEGADVASRHRIDSVDCRNRVRQCHGRLMFTALGNGYKLFL